MMLAFLVPCLSRFSTEEIDCFCCVPLTPINPRELTLALMDLESQTAITMKRMMYSAQICQKDFHVVFHITATFLLGIGPSLHHLLYNPAASLGITTRNSEN